MKHWDTGVWFQIPVLNRIMSGQNYVLDLACWGWFGVVIAIDGHNFNNQNSIVVIFKGVKFCTLDIHIPVHFT